jgi:hypothetical protein
MLVVLLRATLQEGAPAPAPPVAHTSRPAAHQAAVFHRVRAGETLATIAAATGVPVQRLEQLNPNVEPTSLFIGDRVRVR